MAEAVHDLDVGDDKFLVLIGARRWVSGYVNGGKLVEKNGMIRVGAVMGAVLLRREYTETKSGLKKPYFREATEAERNAYLTRLSNLDPETADASLLQEAARAEALGRGEVETSTQRDHEALEELRDNPIVSPARRRRRRATSE